MVALALGLTAYSFAQTSRLPLVELYTDNRGLYFPAGRTLYATIFMDGHIDFMDTSNHDLVIRHDALSHDEVNKIKEMMAKGFSQASWRRPNFHVETASRIIKRVLR